MLNEHREHLAYAHLVLLGKLLGLDGSLVFGLFITVGDLEVYEVGEHHYDTENECKSCELVLLAYDACENARERKSYIGEQERTYVVPEGLAGCYDASFLRGLSYY